MPLFKYLALDSTGNRSKGYCEAADLEEAREFLRNRNLFAEKIQPVKTSPAARVKKNDLAALTRELALLLEGGLTLDTALDAVVGRKRAKTLGWVMHEVRRQVKEGVSFSQALSEHPGIFKKFFVSMVRVGEESGRLDGIMSNLADYMDRSLLVSRRLLSALAYPGFLSVLGVAVLVFLLSYVVPTLTGLFVEMQVTMPLPTLVLLAICAVIRSYWYLLLGGLVLVVLLVHIGLKHDGTRMKIHAFLLRVPFFGKLQSRMHAARFMGALGLMIKNGLPLVQALEVAEGLIGNDVITSRLKNVRERVVRGEALSDSLDRENVFPDFPTQVVMAGEHGGNLGGALLNLARVVDKETQIIMESALAMFEPVIITLFGLIIGFIVISMLLPILGLSQISF